MASRREEREARRRERQGGERREERGERREEREARRRRNGREKIVLHASKCVFVNCFIGIVI